jgi:hypothetical protein
MILISDPGQDLDDEMSYIMLRHLVEENLVDLKGIIATLAPSFDRARLCRGTLDLLGLHQCPVGIGSDGGDLEGNHTAKSFEESAASYMPATASESCATLTPGRGLMYRLYHEAAPRSLTLCIIASLKDAALFLRDHEWRGWWTVPSTRSEDGAPSARRLLARVQLAPTGFRAPRQQLGSSPWPQELA